MGPDLNVTRIPALTGPPQRFITRHTSQTSPRLERPDLASALHNESFLDTKRRWQGYHTSPAPHHHGARRTMMATTNDSNRPVPTTWVITDNGTILIQRPANNQWGFELASDDQTWPGGFGIAQSWEAIPDDDPRITDEDRDTLQWLFDEP
jgi:hypothetical protein